jgi:hypothetical protein
MSLKRFDSKPGCWLSIIVPSSRWKAVVFLLNVKDTEGRIPRCRIVRSLYGCSLRQINKVSGDNCHVHAVASF